MRELPPLALAVLLGPLLVGYGPLGPPAPQEATADVEALVRALEEPDPTAAAAARDALGRLRDEEARRATDALLAEFGTRPGPGRRARAALLAELAGPAELDALLARLDDPEAGVRRAWIDWLVRPDLSRVAIDERVEALARLARSDPDAGLRRRAVEALGTLDDPAAVGALAGLMEVLPVPDRQAVAEGLPSTPRSAELVRRLVIAGFGGALERTSPTVLAALLPLYGRHLADAEADAAGGGEGAIDCAPLILGLRHPSPEVRRATGLAFEELITRLRELGAAERALRVLDGLAERGLDPRVVHFHRARLALAPAADPEAAARSARALRGRDDPASAGARMEALAAGDAYEARLWLHRSLYLEGMARLAQGQPAAARERFVASAEVLDATLAERGDLKHEEARWRHVDALHQRALTDVAIALAALAAGAPPGERAVLERLRDAHRQSLESQVQYAGLAGEALTGWDGLFDSELSPYRLIFTGQSFPGLDLARAVELQQALGRALASVAPVEMPGFAPLPDVDPELADPLADPRRRALLGEVQYERLEGLVERIDELYARIQRRAGLGWDVEQDIAGVERLELRRRFLQDQIARGGQRDAKELLELRIPSALALWLVRDLRGEGRGSEAREVARRMKDDIDRNGISNWWYYLGVERIVRAEIAIGGSYTDDDEPERAAEVLEGAVARLEGIERRMLENGATPADLVGFRALRAGALVSLAVNANVKLSRPDLALGYYERAYELRQDDFMRVLLACYRARSGRDAEARDLLREVRPGPQTWYNMACTYALLGESERALELLAIELRENHFSEASRQRQREWAAADPDLASLRGDPRFEELVGGR